ncbi:MAG: biotin carboxylase N-terminal domain-containing protein [Steroidobacteraceae bacterium]
MIESLLIANRGEIACRIIRTARRLGIRTIAVFSAADAHAPFVKQADTAVPIGPAPAADSYLAGEKILAAARATGAAAIHPGYGFLSENAAFAAAVQDAGLVWIGAPPAAIRAMGLKDAAKALMMRAHVPVTPGYLGEVQEALRLKREASGIGYPVLIKAVAGGGGKGMRRVEDAAGFDEALASCRREAASAFGDDRVLIEKYVRAPRHIEVQVFGDTHGQIVHLFERDCSLQRRHQKVIEEAPAPGMDAATREFVCNAAVKAARAVDYVGAGTIEFIADATHGLTADHIWFMEMNTRLQVEHPVTEAITGQDLVEWQLRVASGEPLPCTQDALSIDGCAMEARLYAENPSGGFLPSTGILRHVRLPSDVRVDSGVEEGGEVTGFYDPMLAKLIVHAPNRRAAARKLAAACGAVQVWPVRTNAALLARIAVDAAFVAGDVDTGFIERRAATLIPPPEPGDEMVRAAAGALLAVRGPDPWSGLVGFRANAPACAMVDVAVGAHSHWVAADPPPSSTATVDGERILFLRGEAWSFGPPDSARVVGTAAVSDGVLQSPMPGRIVSVSVRHGQAVSKGQILLSLEAMKMEHSLIAPFDGSVAELAVSVGDQVAENVALVRIVADSAAREA